MELDGKYRHELKYKIHFSEYLAIRQRLRSVMRPDPHAGVMIFRRMFCMGSRAVVLM